MFSTEESESLTAYFQRLVVAEEQRIAKDQVRPIPYCLGINPHLAGVDHEEDQNR